MPCSAADAFAYVSDFSRVSEWDPGVVESRALGDDARVEVGSRFEVVALFRGKRQRFEYVVTELEEGRRIGLRGDGEKARSRDEIRRLRRRREDAGHLRGGHPSEGHVPCGGAVPRPDVSTHGRRRARRACDGSWARDEGRRRRRGHLGPRRRPSALARARRRGVRERRPRRRPHPHDPPRRARARHGLPRAQRAELSAADAPLPRARRGDAGVGDVVLGDVPVRPRVLGPPAVRAARPRRATGASTGCSGRSAAGCAPRGARSTSSTASAGRSSATSTSAGTRRVPAPLPRAAHRRALVDGAGPRARVPGCRRDPLLRQPRDARAPPLSLAHGDRRRRHVRRRELARGSARGFALGLGVRSLRRDPDGVEIRTGDDAPRRFDAVVVATHADQALRLLEDPSRGRAQPARRVRVHAERRRRSTRTRRTCRATTAARASWNYRLGDDGRPTITYYLNRLQRLETERDCCVTLNGDVAEEHVVDRTVFEHPLFTVDALAAQRELPRLAGARRTWFAGAYHGNGFHEDGLASGVRAAESLGAPW